MNLHIIHASDKTTMALCDDTLLPVDGRHHLLLCFYCPEIDRDDEPAPQVWLTEVMVTTHNLYDDREEENRLQVPVRACYSDSDADTDDNDPEHDSLEAFSLRLGYASFETTRRDPEISETDFPSSANMYYCNVVRTGPTTYDIDVKTQGMLDVWALVFGDEMGAMYDLHYMAAVRSDGMLTVPLTDPVDKQGWSMDGARLQFRSFNPVVAWREQQQAAAAEAPNAKKQRRV